MTLVSDNVSVNHQSSYQWRDWRLVQSKKEEAEKKSRGFVGDRHEIAQTPSSRADKELTEISEMGFVAGEICEYAVSIAPNCSFFYYFSFYLFFVHLSAVFLFRFLSFVAFSDDWGEIDQRDCWIVGLLDYRNRKWKPTKQMICQSNRIQPFFLVVHRRWSFLISLFLASDSMKSNDVWHRKKSTGRNEK